jgi:hypothetical protein
MNKELFIDAIVGCGFKSFELAWEMTNKGLARFSGNQWNPDWSWRRDKLITMKVEELEELYNTLKGS